MIALPTLLLALLCLTKARQHGWWIPLGLLLSAAGDALGSVGLFWGQIGAFALTILCYTAAFLPDGALHRRGVWLLATLLAGGGLALTLWLMQRASTAEAVAVGIYALLLCSMLAASLLDRGPGRAWGIVAALLFVLSDALIGYSRYLAPHPLSDGWTLLPYYAAQLIFALRYVSNSKCRM